MAAESTTISRAQAAEKWLEAAEAAKRDTGGYHPLRRALDEVAPPDGLYGIGYRDEDPVVLILKGERLGILAPLRPREDGGDHPVCLRTLALSEAGLFEVETESEVLRAGTQRRRTWTIAGPGGESVSLLTLSPYNSSFLTDRGGESVMRAAAAKLGWVLPS